MIKADEILQMEAPSLREAITHYFRREIITGRLRPGDGIPASRELAQALNTSSPNVHQALVPLVKSGLLERDRRRGTVVRARPREISCVAIYVYRTNLYDMPRYQQVLIDSLARQLAQRRIASRLVLDNEMMFGIEQIKRWTLADEVQCVLAPLSLARDPEVAKRLRKLPLMVMDNVEIPLDMTAMVARGVATLRRDGCQRIGMLNSANRYAPTAGDPTRASPFHTDFVDALGRAGARVEPDLIRMLRADNGGFLHNVDEITEFAMEQCDALFSLPPARRPDGLLIFPDQLVPGVMLSVLKNKLRVPEDLKLVVHRNWEIKTPLLVPCAMIGFSVAEVAGQLLEGMTRLFHGEPWTPRRIEPEERYFKPS